MLFLKAWLIFVLPTSTNFFFEFLSPRFQTLNPRYIILISFNCTCIFYHIQLTRACPSPLAVIWYLCIGFVSKVNKTENLNSTDSQPGQQWTVFQIVTHTKLGGFQTVDFVFQRSLNFANLNCQVFYHAVLSNISYFYKLASQICKIETPFKKAIAYLTSPNTMYIVCSTYNSEGAWVIVAEFTCSQKNRSYL